MKNSIELLSILLHDQISFVLFTDSSLIFRSTCSRLLQDYRNIDLTVSLLISLFRSSVLSSHLIYLLQRVLSSIAGNLIGHDSVMSCSAVASLSDDNFVSLIAITESVLLQLPGSNLLFPQDMLILPLQQLLSHLPYRERPIFLEPMIRLLSVLRYCHAIPEGVCVSFFQQRVREVCEQETTNLNSIQCLHVMEMFSDLLMDMALHDITIIEQILPTPSPSSKHPRTVMILPPETSLSLYYALLQLVSQLFIHAEHGKEPFLSAHSLEFMIELRNALILFFKEKIVPILGFTSEQLLQQANCSEHLLLSVCVCLCTTQLLDHEEELRLCLYESILQRVRCFMEMERRTEKEQVIKSPSVVVYDGRSKRRRED